MGSTPSAILSVCLIRKLFQYKWTDWANIWTNATLCSSSSVL